MYLAWSQLHNKSLYMLELYGMWQGGMNEAIDVHKEGNLNKFP